MKTRTKIQDPEFTLIYAEFDKAVERINELYAQALERFEDILSSFEAV